MYNAFFSAEAWELAHWALQELRRDKASKLMRIAEKMETRYRAAVNDGTRLIRGGMYHLPRILPVVLLEKETVNHGD